jgi:hypothetical protein
VSQISNKQPVTEKQAPPFNRINLARPHARYVSCPGGPPDYGKTAFLIEANGRDFTAVALQLLRNVATLLRVAAKHPDLVWPAVECFPFEAIVDLAVQRDMAGMSAANMPSSTGRA